MTQKRGELESKPTIYDIAAAAGVSTATVSKVFNQTGRISQTTIDKVMRTARELGYEPNLLASALAGKNSYSIGLLLPDVSNPYFAEIVRGAEDEAFRNGYSLLVCNTDNSVEKEEVYLRALRTKQMDGIVVATGSTSKDTLQSLAHWQTKVMLLARDIPDVPLGTVMVDNFHGGYLAGRHFVELGHRKIGVVLEPLNIPSSRDRLRGLEAALAEAGIVPIVAEGEGHSIEVGRQLSSSLLSKHPLTAVFAANDSLAVGVIQACRDANLQVPEDVSIVGFDDTIFASIVHPPLTTIHQPIYQLGRKTLELLIQAIESGQQPTEKIVLDPVLIVRASSAARHGR